MHMCCCCCDNSIDSIGMVFYEINHKLLKENFDIVYYRTTGAIKKKNLPLMQYTYRARRLPDNPKTQDDYLHVLLSQKMPQVRDSTTRCCQFFLGCFGSSQQ